MTTATDTNHLENDRLLRYSRHILLSQIGEEGQTKISQATILILGLGGLGSPASMYLTACGVKRLMLVDYDKVELSNLQRQIVHTTDSIGERKVDSAAECLKRINPQVEIITYAIKMVTENASSLVKQADIVIDASDNFATRYAINRLCWQYKKPLVSASVIRFEAQLSVFIPSDTDSPCYECLYPPGKSVDEACVNNGVLAPLTGVIGAMQAVETIKLITDIGESLKGHLLLFDALHSEWRKITLPKNPNCEVCR